MQTMRKSIVESWKSRDRIMGIYVTICYTNACTSNFARGTGIATKVIACYARFMRARELNRLHF